MLKIILKTIFIEVQYIEQVGTLLRTQALSRQARNPILHKLARPGSCQTDSNNHELILAVDSTSNHMKPN